MVGRSHFCNPSRGPLHVWEGRYGKVAAGTDLTYDGGAGAKVDIIEGNPVQWRPGAGQRLAIGLYSGYEHVIERFWVLFAIRSIEGRRADFLEVGAGYRILMRPRTQ
jgi:hypothetical protein